MGANVRGVALSEPEEAFVSMRFGPTHVLPAAFGIAFVASMAIASNGAASHEPAVKTSGRHALHRTENPMPITHVVVIVQENRSFDNLFQLLHGADTQSWGYNSQGQKVKLKPVALNTLWDPNHGHFPQGARTGGFVVEYDNGRNDGWDHENFRCTGAPSCSDATAFAYVRKRDVQAYYDLASSYAFGDEMLQANEGPSWPAHQYLIAGQAGGLWDLTNHISESENPGQRKHTDYCNSQSFHVEGIDMFDPYPGTETYTVPCKDYETIFDDFDLTHPRVNGYNWRYHTPNIGLWDAPAGVKHLYDLSLQQEQMHIYGNFAFDGGGTDFANDVATNNLTPLTYITPCKEWSDHAGAGGGLGPDWISFLVDEIGESPYWNSTAIIVTWDDWGGWFDHVLPRHVPNPYNNAEDPVEYGYRVPVLVISPYARHGYADHTPMTQMSILTFIEKVYGLPTLQALDDIQYSGSDLTEMFDFSQSPRPFHPLSVPSGEFPKPKCTLPPDFDG
jgi:phospholipase C